MSYPFEGFHFLKGDQFFKHARATAMILMRHEAIIAKHGQLSPEGFKQFADALRRHWLGWDPRDHDRFVVRMLDGQFHCLGAKRTPSGGYLCGLAFPMDTPLKHMRRDVADLTHLVTRFDEGTDEADDHLEQSLQLTGQPMSQTDPPSPTKVVPEGWQIEKDVAGQIEDEIVPEEPLAQPGIPENNNTEEDLASQADELRWRPLDALLPSDGAQAGGGIEVGREIDHRVDYLTAQLGDLTPSPDDDLVSFFQDDARDFDPHTPQDWQERSPSVTDQDLFLNQDTHPVTCNEDQLSLAETVMDTTFYLVPRMNDHYLLGELALQLRGWFPELCEIYGWELASLSVRPDYLKWTLLDFPECLTRDALGVVRQWTSGHIFTNFPTMQEGNPTQDFWSPGYLVDTQNREFPTQVLVTHISRRRVRQDTPVV